MAKKIKFKKMFSEYDREFYPTIIIDDETYKIHNDMIIDFLENNPDIVKKLGICIIKNKLKELTNEIKETKDIIDKCSKLYDKLV